MNTIQINYDLIGPERNYPRLFAEIERISRTYTRPLKSMWLIRTEMSAEAVLKAVSQYVDANDEVLVVDVTRDAWWTNFKDNSTDWMHQNMGHLRAA
jgi:hypothetical protein